MANCEKHTYENISALAVKQRKAATAAKYSAAVEMYASSDMSIHRIAALCDVTPAGLSHHLTSRHRDLMLARYGLTDVAAQADGLKIKPRRGQTPAARAKYHQAIEACSAPELLKYNISQIARMFGVSGTGLANQLRLHFPEVIPAREAMRRNLNVNDNTPRGARPVSSDTYTRAVEMYASTDMTIAEAADACRVSAGGLSQYMRFYRRDVIKAKALRRQQAMAGSADKPGRQGSLSGNGSCYGPKPATVMKYSAATAMFHGTAMSVDEIAEATGVTPSGFAGYHRQWNHAADGCTPRSRRAAAAKYAPAIESLRANPRPVAAAAAEFNLKPDMLRKYLRKHEPELAALSGMERTAGGKTVSRSATARYADAIREYATSAETLKSIARRHGLTYNSLSGYVSRNCPDERESHNRMVAAAAASPIANFNTGY